METVVVLLAALVLFAALVLALRRQRRVSPDDAYDPDEKAQRAESWLTKGGGRSS
jgi:hypothetical protein